MRACVLRGRGSAVLAVPGDLDSATTTIVGGTIWTEPETHEKVLRSVGRQVVATDGTIEFRSGQQPSAEIGRRRREPEAPESPERSRTQGSEPRPRL